MKRDMNLIRSLLLLVEEKGDDINGCIEDVVIEGCTEEQISHHVWLLSDGGYITAMEISTFVGTCHQPRALTWRGHEFLDAVRAQDIWQQTLALAKDGGAEGINAIFQIAKALGQKKLERLLGLSG